MHKYDSPEVSEPPDGASSQKESRLNIALVGVGGYAGLELARLLKHHPKTNLKICFSTKPDFRFEDYLPGNTKSLQNVVIADLKDLKVWLKDLDVIFLATPHEVSLELVPEILKAKVNVIDLSGVFRLQAGNPKDVYQNFYKLEHSALDLLKEAQYGLSPWNKLSLKNSPALVSNPGCYATSVLMALLPLLKKGLIEPDSIVIDAKSGATGAGRKAAENLLFTEVDGECLPYKVGHHQHLPEIEQAVEKFASVSIKPFFATHLLPIRRGIISALYARLKPAVSSSEISSAFHEAYADYGMVQWGALSGTAGRADAHALSLKSVVGTNLTRISYQLEGDKIYLFSLIDNLIKGAAGQAIENLNALYQLPLALGLEVLEGQI